MDIVDYVTFKEVFCFIMGIKSFQITSVMI